MPNTETAQYQTVPFLSVKTESSKMFLFWQILKSITQILKKSKYHIDNYIGCRYNITKRIYRLPIYRLTKGDAIWVLHKVL